MKLFRTNKNNFYKNLTILLNKRSSQNSSNIDKIVKKI